MPDNETTNAAAAGDVTTENTKAVPCAKCRENKTALENAFPIKKPICISREQIDRIGLIDAEKAKDAPKDEEIISLYNLAFKAKVTPDLFTGSLRNAVVKDLKKYYDVLKTEAKN